MEEQEVIVNWYGLKPLFETTGENLNNGWWYIKMGNEYQHIEEKYITVFDRLDK